MGLLYGISKVNISVTTLMLVLRLEIAQENHLIDDTRTHVVGVKASVCQDWVVDKAQIDKTLASPLPRHLN